MVFYFTCISDPSYLIYMGKNKDENEVLLKYGFPEDVWFHVDPHSSAHVYLRLKADEKLEDVPKAIIMECAQLVKANSIKGSKLDNVAVIYTPYPNLRKTKQMEAGEVGFHDEKKVLKVVVKTKDRALVRQLEKTKQERFPDLKKARADRDAEEKRQRVHELKQKQKAEREAAARNRKKKELQEYKGFFDEDAMQSNQELNEMNAEDYEDGFM